MIAFSIGPISIYRYGIFYAISFLIGYFFLKYLAHKFIPTKHEKTRYILKEKTEELIIYIILGVLIGGRLGHVIIYDLHYYISNPFEIFQIWKGGMSFIGGMIGVIISLLIFKKVYKINSKDYLLIADSILTIVPLGIALGRIGNFLNQELYGIITPQRLLNNEKMVNFSIKTKLLYVYEQIDTNLRINTNFLSIIFEGFILLAITNYIFYKKKNRKTGFISCIFLIYYSTIRFLLEYLRYDSQSEFVFHLTKSQRFFLVFTITGIILLIKTSKSNNHTSG